MKEIYQGNGDLLEEIKKEDAILSAQRTKLTKLYQERNKQMFYDMKKYKTIEEVVEILKDDYYDLVDHADAGDQPDIPDIQIICGDGHKYSLSFEIEGGRTWMDCGPHIYHIEEVTDISYKLIK